MIVNLGMSKNFGDVDFSHLPLPTKMEVDYIRVYQKSDTINIGCDPVGFPTASYIEKYVQYSPFSLQPLLFLDTSYRLPHFIWFTFLPFDCIPLYASFQGKLTFDDAGLSHSISPGTKKPIQTRTSQTGGSTTANRSRRTLFWSLALRDDSDLRGSRFYFVPPVRPFAHYLSIHPSHLDSRRPNHCVPGFSSPPD